MDLLRTQLEERHPGIKQLIFIPNNASTTTFWHMLPCNTW